MGNLPVVADKVYQSVAASADGLEHLEYFGFGSLIALQLFYLSGQQDVYKRQVLENGFHVAEYLKQKARLSIDDSALQKGKGKGRSAAAKMCIRDRFRRMCSTLLIWAICRLLPLSW